MNSSVSTIPKTPELTVKTDSPGSQLGGDEVKVKYDNLVNILYTWPNPVLIITIVKTLHDSPAYCVDDLLDDLSLPKEIKTAFDELCQELKINSGSGSTCCISFTTLREPDLTLLGVPIWPEFEFLLSIPQIQELERDRLQQVIEGIRSPQSNNALTDLFTDWFGYEEIRRIDEFTTNFKHQNDHRMVPHTKRTFNTLLAEVVKCTPRSFTSPRFQPDLNEKINSVRGFITCTNLLEGTSKSIFEKRLKEIALILSRQEEELNHLVDSLNSNGLTFANSKFLDEVDSLIDEYEKGKTQEKSRIDILSNVINTASYMRFCYNKTLSDITEVNNIQKGLISSANLQQKKAILLLGMTGAGKSTAITYLLGAKMERRKNDVGEIITVLGETTEFPCPSIGLSESMYTQSFDSPNFPVTLVETTILTEDCFRSHDEFLTKISLDQAMISAASTCALVLVIPLQHFTSKDANEVVTLLSSVQERFPNILNDKSTEHNGLFVLLTKVDQCHPDVYVYLDDRLKELIKIDQGNETQSFRIAVWKLLKNVLSAKKMAIVNLLDRIEQETLIKLFSSSSHKITYQPQLNKEQLDLMMWEHGLSDAIYSLSRTWSAIMDLYLRDNPTKINFLKKTTQLECSKKKNHCFKRAGECKSSLKVLDKFLKNPESFVQLLNNDAKTKIIKENIENEEAKNLNSWEIFHSFELEKLNRVEEWIEIETSSQEAAKKIMGKLQEEIERLSTGKRKIVLGKQSGRGCVCIQLHQGYRFKCKNPIHEVQLNKNTPEGGNDLPVVKVIGFGWRPISPPLVARISNIFYAQERKYFQWFDLDATRENSYVMITMSVPNAVYHEASITSFNRDLDSFKISYSELEERVEKSKTQKAILEVNICEVETTIRNIKKAMQQQLETRMSHLKISLETEIDKCKQEEIWIRNDLETVLTEINKYERQQSHLAAVIKWQFDNLKALRGILPFFMDNVTLEAEHRACYEKLAKIYDANAQELEKLHEESIENEEMSNIILKKQKL